LFANLAQRLEQILASIQIAVTGPVREGVALMSAFRAMLHALRDIRAGRTRARTEDEDALFI
jgi:hypothetical protein